MKKGFELPDVGLRPVESVLSDPEGRDGYLRIC